MALNTTSDARPKTKIVCTLGPSTDSDETLEALIDNGMSVARLNMSHGTLESHARSMAQVVGASERLGIPVSTMVDVPGAKYRTGPLDCEAVDWAPGDQVTLTSRDVVGMREIVAVAPPGIHRDAAVGHPIVLDDGLVRLRATRIVDESVECEVVVGGRITERRGVTVPGVTPSQPYPDSSAKRALEFAAQYSADFVALSTVTSRNEVDKARGILNDLGAHPHVISKVERAEAVERFDEILAVSDAIMVARGDMGVEVPLAKVPVIQKDLIAKSNAAGKPVITATQMLESMVTSQVPTRAEVTDVANAVFDGSDAVMLSGETSIGENPVEAVRVMARVAKEAEEALPYEAIIREKSRHLVSQVDDAISYDACRTASQLHAGLIIAFTESGGTAGRVSKYRPRPPILALTQSPVVQRRLTLRWGVTPVIADHLRHVDDFFTMGREAAIESRLAEAGSLVILVAGLPIGVSGGTNLLRVMTLD